ncbi:MAG: YidC/Oxa1 family membrane protein insertase [Candidatus Shapirobacteria bacterium]|nr:YidC/Oxa1 family membrane protein insertase [Candidatus Shapirobacteria bacterium]
MSLWGTLLYHPIVNALIFFYEILFHNFGLAIIVLTLIIRGLLVPLTLPSMRAAQKIKELAPELEKLKKKYADDKKKLAQAQMELYRQHGANPAAGCLPQIVQLIILIALYQAFIGVLRSNGDVIARLNQILYPSLKLAEGTIINTRFWYLNLATPDVFHLNGLSFPLPGLFLILAALSQFISSKMMMPEVANLQKEAEKTETKTDDMATSMQRQMLYLFPLMTIFIGFTFPSGLVLYWFIFSLSTVVQQYYISGWGGLKPWINKIKFLKK